MVTDKTRYVYCDENLCTNCLIGSCTAIFTLSSPLFRLFYTKKLQIISCWHLGTHAKKVPAFGTILQNLLESESSGLDFGDSGGASRVPIARPVLWPVLDSPLWQHPINKVSQGDSSTPPDSQQVRKNSHVTPEAQPNCVPNVAKVLSNHRYYLLVCHFQHKLDFKLAWLLLIS